MITAKDIKEYQDRSDCIKTIGEFKALGRELRDKFNLTDQQAIGILNKDYNVTLEVLLRD